MLLPVTGVAAGYQLLLAVLLLISGWHARRNCTAVDSLNFVCRLSWEHDNRVEVMRRDGSSAILQLQPDAFVTPWLVVLRLRDADGELHHLPVLPDMLPGQEFRRLRVRLRLEVPRLAGSCQ